MNDDEKLIACVRKHPELYDLSSDKYMDVGFKNEIWKKIGDELDLDGSACKSRWNNIRDTYRKSVKRNAKKRDQGANKIKKYKYSEILSFLTKYSLEDRGSISNLESEEDTPQTKKETDDSLLQIQEETDDSLHHSQECEYEPRSKRRPPNDTSPRKLRKLENEPTTTSKFMEYVLLPKNETVQSHHQVDTFVASIAATLKTFSPYHLHLAKSEIFNIVQKYEYETIMGHEESNRTINSQFFPTSTSTISTQHSPIEKQDWDNNIKKE
ncbi:uncharacterized protein LOC123678761 [Harmonia axyridis]|uniref:uncharacterized protein LOC123678761 n=1 Tax=Harmonia axyridis TaxID=115357 RepID=UPI001E2757E2|nr:uncharacterized protein LOC123678761 [Harmonia axyridis]